MLAIRWKSNEEREVTRLRQSKINSGFYSFLGGILGAIGVWIIACVVVYWYPNMFAATKKWEIQISQNTVKEITDWVIADHLWDTGLSTLILGGMFFAAVLGFFLPFWKRLEVGKILVNRIPLEIIAVMFVWFKEGIEGLPVIVARFYRLNGRYPLEEQYPFFYQASEAWIITMGWLVQITVVFLFLYAIYVIVVSLRQIITLRPLGYFFRRTIVGFCCYQVVRLFRKLGKLLRKIYTDMLGTDMENSYNWNITKVVAINFIVLATLSSFWWLSIPILLLYSVVIFYFIRNYIGKIQNGYKVIASQVEAMNQGKIDGDKSLGDAGPFSYLQKELEKVQMNVSLAVEEKTKSQKMKTELITNVSHDLKTPLTAIITYVNLLKEDGLTEEQRKNYINILDQKSRRLKILIEDLFEASKAASGNVELQMRKVNLGELICQVYYEMADLLEAAEVDVRMHLPQEKVILNLDSQKTYRIFANLIGNIAKYGLKGTRAWINFVEMNDEITVVIKNISASDLDGVTPQSLTERFVRGDASRTTEGSGLGLAIAKSFTELQGGKLELEIDGDMFKAFVTFPKLKEETSEQLEREV